MRKQNETARLLFLRAIRYRGTKCLLWPFDTVKGYGKLRIGGRHWRICVLICTIVHGSRPTPKHHAAHSCGVRACVNPMHLRWATAAENEADKLIHGRRHGGAGAGRAVTLTPVQAEAIRAAVAAAARTQRQLAVEFGVSKSTVNNIVLLKGAWRPEWLR